MIRTFIVGAATLAFIGAASAQVVVPKNQEFYATPIQKGAPTDLPGERLIPGASQTAGLIDQIISPVVVTPLQQVGTGVGAGVGPVIAGIPILGDGAAAAPAAEPAMMKKKRHHHRYGKHSMHHKAKKAMHIQ